VQNCKVKWQCLHHRLHVQVLNLAHTNPVRKSGVEECVVKNLQQAAYRKIAKLEAELEAAKRNAAMYKKRFQREKAANMKSDTPCTKTRKLLANFTRHKQSVRKTLVFHYALIDQIKDRYQDTKTEREKEHLLVCFLVE